MIVTAKQRCRPKLTLDMGTEFNVERKVVISSHSRLSFFVSAIYAWCNLLEERIKNNRDIYVYKSEKEKKKMLCSVEPSCFIKASSCLSCPNSINH